MHRRFALAFLVAAPYLNGCTEINTAVPVAFQGELVAVGGATTIGGSVAAVSQRNRTTEAGITIRYGVAPATLGWQINLGSCAAPGERLGGRGGYPDVTIEPNTSGTTEPGGTGVIERTFISADMRESGQYHAVVVDAETRETVLACGDLSPVRF